MVSKNTSLTREELLELTKYPHLAVLVTVTPKGEPRTTPCWYEYDGETFNCSSITTQAKVGYIRNNPKVSLIVVYTSLRGQPLLVQGTAELIDEGISTPSKFRERMAHRYQPGERAKDYMKTMDAQGRTMIRIWPDKILYHEGERAMPLNVLANIDRLVGH